MPDPIGSYYTKLKKWYPKVVWTQWIRLHKSNDTAESLRKEHHRWCSKCVLGTWWALICIEYSGSLWNISVCPLCSLQSAPKSAIVFWQGALMPLASYSPLPCSDIHFSLSLCPSIGERKVLVPMQAEMSKIWILFPNLWRALTTLFLILWRNWIWSMVRVG